jgi:hypothetical protein
VTHDVEEVVGDAAAAAKIAPLAAAITARRDDKKVSTRPMHERSKVDKDLQEGLDDASSLARIAAFGSKFIGRRDTLKKDLDLKPSKNDSNKGSKHGKSCFALSLVSY